MSKKKPVVEFENETLKAVIKEGGEAGYYLFVKKNGIGQGDWLQDDLDMAKRCARDLFHIPMNAWAKVHEDRAFKKIS